MPAIPLNSPLTEELGEPRPEPVALSLGGAAETTAQSGWWQSEEAREKLVNMTLLAIMAAAILYVASQLLPTAATVAIDPPAGAESMVKAAETAAPNPVQIPAVSNKEQVPDPVKIAGLTVPQPVALKELATSSVDISAAKTAPVVAVVPSAVKPKPFKAPKPPVSVRSGRYLLQLASLPTAQDAKREVSRLQNRLRGVLGKRKIAVVRAVPKGKGPVYRLRASAYQTRNSARSACDRVRKLKVGCLVVRR